MKHSGKKMFRLLFAASALFLSTSLSNQLVAQCDSPVGLQINEEIKDGELVGIKVYGSDGTDDCGTNLSVCGDVEVKGLLAIEEKAEVRFSGSKWTASGRAKMEGKGAVRVVEKEDCGTTGTPEIDGGGDCDSPDKMFSKLIVETSKNVKFVGKTAVRAFEFSKGKAILEEDLCVEDVTGACADKYFVTNPEVGATSGGLKSRFAYEKTFHVGSEDEYAPIKVENTSGSDEIISVRTLKATYEDGNAGAEMTTAMGTSWEVKGLSKQAQINVSVATTGVSKGTDFQEDRNFLSRYIGVMENEVGGFKSESKWDYTGYEGCGTTTDEQAEIAACNEDSDPSSTENYIAKSRSFEAVEMSDTELFSIQRCKPNCATVSYFEGGKGYVVCFESNDGINIEGGESSEILVNGKMEKYTRVQDEITNNVANINCIVMEQAPIYNELNILGCTTPVFVASLPVELTYFKGAEDNCKVVLTWETASEKNNDYFEVQRSVDGRSYEPIGLVDGAGTIADIQTYRFIDKDPLAFAYYRLRQVDFDGTEDYSSVIRMVSSCFDKTMVTSVYPNPTDKEWVNLELASSGFGDVKVTISDLLGRQLQVRNYAVTDGINNVRLDISTMPAGTYVIHVYEGLYPISSPLKLVKTRQQ